MRSIDFTDVEPQLVRPSGELIVRCPQFTVEKWNLDAARPANDHPAYTLFFCLSGAVEMAGVQIVPGDFFLVPAAAHTAPLEPRAPGTSLLRVTPPAA
jgi:mannose-6-phosphate isomerase class I